MKELNIDKVLVNKFAPGYDLVYLTNGKGAEETLLRMMVTVSDTERAAFQTLALDRGIPLAICQARLAHRFWKRGAPLFDLAGLRAVMTMVAPNAAQNVLYMQMISHLLTLVGAIKEEIPVVTFKRELRLLPDDAVFAREMRCYGFQKLLTTWTQPLSTVTDVTDAMQLSNKLSLCMSYFVHAWQNARSYLDSLKRTKEIIRRYIWDAPLVPFLRENRDLQSLARIGNFVMAALAKGPFTPAEMAEDAHTGYVPFHDDRRVADVAAFINDKSTKLEMISVEEYKNMFTLLPVLTSHTKELRVVGILPAIETPKPNFKLWTSIPASQVLPNALALFDCAAAGAAGASSQLAELMAAAVTAAPAEALLRTTEMMLELYADSPNPTTPFVEVRVFGDLPTTKSMDVTINQATYPDFMMLFYLALCETWDLSAGAPRFHKMIEHDGVMPLSERPKAVQIANKEIWTYDPQYLVLACQRRIGTNVRKECNTPSAIIRDRSVVLFPDDRAPVALAAQKVSITFRAPDASGELKPGSASIELAKLVDMEDVEGAFYFYDTSAITYFRMLASAVGWALDLKLNAPLKWHMIQFALAPLMKCSNTPAAVQGAHLILAEGGAAYYRQRNLNDRLARLAISVGVAAGLISKLTMSEDVWEKVMEYTSEVQMSLQTYLLSQGG